MGRGRVRRSYQFALVVAAVVLLGLSVTSVLPPPTLSVLEIVLVFAVALEIGLPRRAFGEATGWLANVTCAAMLACACAALSLPGRPLALVFPVFAAYAACAYFAARRLEPGVFQRDEGGWTRRMQRAIAQNPRLDQVQVALLWGLVRIPGRSMLAWMVSMYVLCPVLIGALVLLMGAALLSASPLIEIALAVAMFYAFLLENDQSGSLFRRTRSALTKERKKEWLIALAVIWKPRGIILLFMAACLGFVAVLVVGAGSLRTVDLAGGEALAPGELLDLGTFVAAVSAGLAHAVIVCQRLLVSQSTRNPPWGIGWPTYAAFFVTLVLATELDSIWEGRVLRPEWAVFSRLAGGVLVGILCWTSFSRAPAARHEGPAFWALLVFFGAFLTVLGGLDGVRIFAATLVIGALWSLVLPIARNGERRGSKTRVRYGRIAVAFVGLALYGAWERVWGLVASALVGVVATGAAMLGGTAQERLLRWALGISLLEVPERPPVAEASA